MQQRERVQALWVGWRASRLIIPSLLRQWFTVVLQVESSVVISADAPPLRLPDPGPQEKSRFVHTCAVLEHLLASCLASDKINTPPSLWLILSLFLCVHTAGGFLLQTERTEAELLIVTAPTCVIC